MANVAPRVRRPGLPDHWGGCRPRLSGPWQPRVTITSVSALQWFLVIAIAALSLYAALLLWLIRAGRREEAIAVARFIPGADRLARPRWPSVVRA